MLRATGNLNIATTKPEVYAHTRDEEHAALARLYAKSIDNLCPHGGPVAAPEELRDADQFVNDDDDYLDGEEPDEHPLRLLTPPPLGPERPTSVHHHNYDASTDLRIVQWNVNGLQTATATLWNDIIHGKISALLIQEQYIHYKHAKTWNPINLRGYHRYDDPHHKTAIYVRDGIKHRKIPLKLHSAGDKDEDCLHATAVAMHVKVNNI